MKKLLIISVILILGIISVSGQSCLPNGIEFNTQAQIDNFQTNHPNCTEIEGNVMINGDDITNLNGLSVLTSFRSDLSIGWGYNSNSNPNLINLSGLDSVISIRGRLEITDNSNLTSLTGLEGLTSIGGDLSIWDNDALTSLSGLGNVTSIKGYLRIEDNNALTSLSGLDNVTSVGGSISIVENNSLTSLSGLDNVTSIEGYLYIGGNYALTSLSGLDNINPESIEDLYIYENQWLSDCAILSICNYLENPNGTIEILDNTTGCNTPEEVQDSCVANAVSIEEVNLKNKLLIYPNPTYSEITISGIDGVIDEISIYNRLGQRVIYAVATDNNLDVSMLPPGLYVIEVAWDGYRVRQKLIVQ